MTKIENTNQAVANISNSNISDFEYLCLGSAKIDNSKFSDFEKDVLAQSNTSKKIRFAYSKLGSVSKVEALFVKLNIRTRDNNNIRYQHI